MTKALADRRPRLRGPFVLPLRDSCRGPARCRGHRRPNEQRSTAYGHLVRTLRIPLGLNDVNQLLKPYGLTVMGGKVLANTADQLAVMCGPADHVHEQFRAIAADHELDRVR